MKRFVVSEGLEIKELCLDEDVVLLASACTRDHTGLSGSRTERNAMLAALLLQRCHGARKGLRPSGPAMKGDAELIEGFLGKPELVVGGKRGPSVSFSHVNGSTWAALCPSGASVGIDATEPGEFVGAYPFFRVFHTEELELAAMATRGDRVEAAALLWSAKEAVVKALGCGFHLIAPLDVRIVPTDGKRGMAKTCADFSEKTQTRFQTLRAGTVRVTSFREPKVWVSTALSSWTTTDHPNQR